jgi:hypothetical protein
MDSVLNDDEDERQINPAVTSVLSELHHWEIFHHT